MITEYRLTRRVNFHETDAAGIVHFSWYPRYMEEAEHAMWRAAGLSIHPDGTEVGWPRVSLAVDYHASLLFEDEFEVEIRIVEMARTSIRYTCRITRGADRIATGSLTVVCVVRRPGERARAMDIPAAVTERLGVATGVEGP